MYSSKTKTFNIRDMEGKIIDTERALIWEGVTLVSEKVKTFTSQVELKNSQQQEIDILKSKSAIDTNANFDALLKDKHRGPILEELK